ncbi:MAG: ABC transporter substrate binding protein [Candidatus Methylomirabilales bacterium]
MTHSSVPDGGLACYSPNFSDMYRRAGGHVARIVKGINPADLPVQQPTRYEPWVNLKTARALGLAILDSVLIRTDKVIQ